MHCRPTGQSRRHTLSVSSEMTWPASTKNSDLGFLPSAWSASARGRHAASSSHSKPRVAQLALDETVVVSHGCCSPPGARERPLSAGHRAWARRRMQSGPAAAGAADHHPRRLRHRARRSDGRTARQSDGQQWKVRPCPRCGSGGQTAAVRPVRGPLPPLEPSATGGRAGAATGERCGGEPRADRAGPPRARSRRPGTSTARPAGPLARRGRACGAAMAAHSDGVGEGAGLPPRPVSTSNNAASRARVEPP